jgi:hypothetical protein
VLRFHSAVPSWPSPFCIQSRPSLQLQVAWCIGESPQQRGGRRRWKPRQALHGLWWFRRPRQWRRRVRRRFPLPVSHAPLPTAVMTHVKFYLLCHSPAIPTSHPDPEILPPALSTEASGGGEAEAAAETKDHHLGALERCVPVHVHAGPPVSHLPGLSACYLPTYLPRATTSYKRGKGKRGI